MNPQSTTLCIDAVQQKFTNLTSNIEFYESCADCLGKIIPWIQNVFMECRVEDDLKHYIICFLDKCDFLDDTHLSLKSEVTSFESVVLSFVQDAKYTKVSNLIYCLICP